MKNKYNVNNIIGLTWGNPNPIYKIIEVTDKKIISSIHGKLNTNSEDINRQLALMNDGRWSVYKDLGNGNYKKIDLTETNYEIWY